MSGFAPFLTKEGRRLWRQGWDDFLATGNPEGVAYARLPERRRVCGPREGACRTRRWSS